MHITKIVTLILVLVSSTVYAEPPVYTTNLLDAIAESESSKKDILVIFTAEWCKYCHILKDDIEKNTNILEDKIVCYIDYDQNKELIKEFKVKIIPDSIILRKRIEVKRKVGYINMNDFEKWLKQNE